MSRVLYLIGRKVGNPKLFWQKSCCAAEGPDAVSQIQIMTRTPAEGIIHD